MGLFIPQIKGYKVKCVGEFGNVVYVRQVKGKGLTTLRHGYALSYAALGLYQSKKGRRKLKEILDRSFMSSLERKVSR